MNTRMQIQWRRAKTLELSSKGNSQVEIASQLQVNEVTVSRDSAALHFSLDRSVKDQLQDRHYG